MACGGCRNGKGARHGAGDLSKFAFLSPRQLRLIKETQQPTVQDSPTVPSDKPGEE